MKDEYRCRICGCVIPRLRGLCLECEEEAQATEEWRARARKLRRRQYA